MKFLAKGKRGIVFKTTYKGKAVVVKEKRNDSAAINSIENEAHWLRILNKESIGPKMYSFSNGRLVMEYIGGEPFHKWFEKHRKKKGLVGNILKKVLQQCYSMDRLSVEKKEMHRPIKHIIVRDNKPILIDFERCRKTLKPSNVTQFCQFLRRLKLMKQNKKLLSSYKKTMSRENLQKIQLLIK